LLRDRLVLRLVVGALFVLVLLVPVLVEAVLLVVLEQLEEAGRVVVLHEVGLFVLRIGTGIRGLRRER
jgi:hypothetical protein